MARAHVRKRVLKSGLSYTVIYRLGGRGARLATAGTFKTEAEAEERCAWVNQSIAGMTLYKGTDYVSSPRDRDKKVYIAELGGLLKIGIAKDPERRCKELHANLLHVEDGGGKRERELHAKFAHLRVQGEFFKPGSRGEIRRYITAAERWGIV